MERLSFLTAINLVVSAIVAFASIDSAFAAESLQKVACPAKGVPRLDLYDETAKPSGVKVDAYTLLTAFQGWGKNAVFQGKAPKQLKFIRVQVPGDAKLASKNLYVYEGAIVEKSQCEKRRAQTIAQFVESQKDVAATAHANNTAADDEDEEEDDDEAAPSHEAQNSTNGIGGLSNLNCCIFPLKTKPRSFLGGMAQFDAGRRFKRKGRVVGTRKHAGADLYGTRGQGVFAVADGTVIRAPYPFKRPTLAIDVRHKGGFVVRYAEVTGKSFGLRLGGPLKQGQQIGAMGYVPGAPKPMIHFELYRGSISGKLTQGHTRYMRRGDLLNPTSYLRRWGKI